MVDGSWMETTWICLYVQEILARVQPGWFFSATGSAEHTAEMIYQLREGEGARITTMSIQLVCEDVAQDPEGVFTLGLAFDDDLEESALLAITLRHPRNDPGDEEEEEKVKPVNLQLNGTTAMTDVGTLPVFMELDVKLCWDSNRSASLRYRTATITDEDWKLGKAQPVEVGTEWRETSTGFYTTSVDFDSAKACFIRGTGTVKVRLLHLTCRSHNTTG